MKRGLGCGEVFGAVCHFAPGRVEARAYPFLGRADVLGLVVLGEVLVFLDNHGVFRKLVLLDGVTARVG